MSELTKEEIAAMKELSKEQFDTDALEQKILHQLEQKELIHATKIIGKMSKLIVPIAAVVAILAAIYFIGQKENPTIEETTVSVNKMDVLQKMSKLVDQFNQSFNLNTLKDDLTIIYITGKHDPFSKIYDKHKGKKIVENVQFIGGFKEMMQGWDTDKKKKHLQEAFVSRYGKDHFRILLDLESEIATPLSIEGYAILEISHQTGTIISQQEYGLDRVAFFKDLKKYFKE